MANKKPSPLRASFWLTEQEKYYVLALCAIFLLGLAARYYYLMSENPLAYAPPGVEQAGEKP